jgi:hypothetical protein
VELLAIEPSRVLVAWWFGLHGVVGLALYLSFGLPALAGLPALILHFRLRSPDSVRILIVSDGSIFCLPQEQRFGLRLTAASRQGPGWFSLVFSDRPGSPLLVLRDQLDDSGWRHLRLALHHSD